MKKLRKWWLFKAENYGKLILLLVIIIILLQGFHMVFLMKLENQSKVWRKSLLHPNAAVTKNLRVKQSNKTRVLVNSIVAKIGKPYVLDSSGVYFIIPNIITAAGNHSDGRLDVTLCLQTTANHLHHLKDLSVTWDGPVSVAVFTYGKDTLFAVYSILYLHSCFESVHNTVSFHLIFPVNQAPANLVSISKLNFNCSGSDYLRLDKMRGNYNIFSLPYPNNLLRNVAISNAKSDYILVLDIDMVPAKFLRKQFVDFIQRQAGDKESNSSNNIAYVVPCFESKTEDLVAKSKQELIRDWNNHEVKPFYFEVCWKCQKATDYEQWRHSQSVDFTYLAYYVDWQDPWEPFYIAKRKSLPLYDERFKQYGFNRISQGCELHVAGFKFAVLNNGFVVHKGYKTADTFHSKKDEENDKNRELFREFKEGLKTRYPESKLQC